VIAMLVAEGRDPERADRHRERLRQAHPIVEYTRHGRGTKGMIAIQQSERNGKVVAATLVRPATRSC
jgi:DNA gyrase subunit A